MSLIVMKFGGTSVGNAVRIRETAKIVHKAAARDRIVVVISALGGITDVIIRSLEAAKNNSPAASEEALQIIETRHRTTIAELFEGPLRATVEADVMAVHKQLSDFCSALRLLRSSTPQVLDVALPMGEKMSALIFSRYLSTLGGTHGGTLNSRGEFIDSTRLIVTDDHFGDSNPDLEATRVKTRELLLPLLDAGTIPVAMGFTGATADGRPTTLGRGGSDFSATILGAVLPADEVYIWTDVDGVLSADPRICPDAETLPEITFAEAIELSYYGAKVIHPRATRPAMEKGIPVWIKNSFNPEVPGTKIASPTSRAGFAIKAVTSISKAALVSLTARSDVHFAEIFGRLFLRLAHEHADILFSTQSSSENTLGLVLRESETDAVVHAINRLFRTELKHGVVKPISVQRDVAVIAVLGESMRGQWGILARIFTAVAKRNVSVIAVAQGTSELSICFAVASSAATEVVRAVHDEFFGARFREGRQSSQTAGKAMHS